MPLVMELGGSLTLRAHHDEGDLGDGPECAELVVVAVHLLEAGLVLQAEHQDHRVHPAGELREGRRAEVRGQTEERGALRDSRGRRPTTRQWFSNGGSG